MNLESGARFGDAYGAAEHAARTSYGRLFAHLAARCGDLEVAQDALADAFTAALEHWPADGVPRRPEAWLLVTARRRAIDAERNLQRDARLTERIAEIAADAFQSVERGEVLTDERLGMMFACAHPALSANVHAPLMLHAVLGLDAARIASPFLVAPAAMSQRLVRAKRKLAATGVRLRIPDADERAVRLTAVLNAIYAAYTAGWDDPEGEDARVSDLAREAIWLGRLAADVLPDDAEALGLLALMLATNARRDARRDAGGAFVPLDAQDPRAWFGAEIDESEALLARAAAFCKPDRFQLEAAIQSAHAVRRHGYEPDWPAIVLLYDELARITGSPVAVLNRAAAVGRARGAEHGLAALSACDADARMSTYQPYWATRADLLARLGRSAEAADAYLRAVGLTSDPVVRAHLIRAAATIGAKPGRLAPVPGS